jgi:iduronate 2-sulfatase
MAQALVRDAPPAALRGSLLLLMVVLMVAPPVEAAAAKKSVLMFAVDDLRTQLSIYPEGGKVMHTPNFERIAQQYVMVALCMPSRTSLLTGRRPDTSRSWTIETDQWFRNSGGNWTTLPGKFKAEGYLTIGMGKIFHETMPSWDPQDAHVSWSPEAVFPDGGQRGKGGLFDPPGIGKEGKGALAHRFPDEEEPTMQDGNITNHAISTIEKMAAGGFGADVASGTRPFFLAVGFHKPVSQVPPPS